MARASIVARGVDPYWLWSLGPGNPLETRLSAGFQDQGYSVLNLTIDRGFALANAIPFRAAALLETGAASAESATIRAATLEAFRSGPGGTPTAIAVTSAGEPDIATPRDDPVGGLVRSTANLLNVTTQTGPGLIVAFGLAKSPEKIRKVL